MPDLAAKIKIPPEAVIPLLIAMVGIVILLAFGAALARWKAKNPRTAEVVGIVVAVGLTGFTGYMLATIVPAKYIDHGAPGHKTLGFLDGPIAGISALGATVFWRFANRRWVALGVGLAAGLALFIKPFVSPLYGWYEGYGSEAHEHPWSFMDPEHLSFHGPGVAVIIAALIAFRMSPAKR